MHTLTKILQFPLTKIIVGIVVCFAAFLVVQNFVLKPLFYAITSDQEIANPVIHVASLVVLLLSYYLLFRWYDRRNITELSVKQLPRELLGGLGLGFLTISLAIFILYLSGHYQVVGWSTAHYPLRLFTLLLVAALMEDLFHRGLILRVCEKWLGTHPALVIAMLVEMQHVFNPNSNLFSWVFYLIWGFTMGMLFIYTQRIWLPYFFHIGWNFSQPFYGSNLTGVDDLGSILQSTFTGPELLTGGAVGIGNSIITAVLLLTIGVVFYYLAYKEGKIVKSRLFNNL